MAALREDAHATRGDIQAASLMLTGHALIARINLLMMEELNFRQALAANPNSNSKDAVVMGTRLQNMAVALNQDIAAFNQALAAIPSDQRPYLARSLNTFDTVYWTPAMQRLTCYNTQFQQSAGTVYQPLYASAPWLQCWMTNYQTSLNSIAMVPQTFASARWWCAGPVVLGSTESYPFCATCQNNLNAQAGNLMVLPNGTTVYVPAGSMPFANTCSTCQASTCPAQPSCTTCGMGMTTCPVTPAAPAPAPATPPAPIPPVTRGAD